MMKQTVRNIYHEAAEAQDDKEREELVKHAKASESKKRITDALHLARSEPGIAVMPSELDSDPWVLNCENGTVDLVGSGALMPHERKDLTTKIAPVKYDPDAKAPTWEAFLERILPAPSLRSFVQRVIGYAATGSVSEEILTIFHGVGANGKSTLVNAIMEALGDYAIQAAPDLLMVKRGSHPTELADLFGARFVASVEADEGRRLAEGLVKQLTGRDKIKARRMREDFWQFDPTHTVFLSTNHRPEIRGTDHGIWRRIRLVPFDVKIPEEEQDKRLAEKLKRELPGILAWIVRGCLEWQREGLGEPDEVKNATEGYRSDMDVLAAFIAECCVVAPNATAKATPLYNAYKAWCEESGEAHETQRRFGMRLTERNFEREKVGGSYRWHGIGLRHDEPGPFDGNGPGSENNEFAGKTARHDGPTGPSGRKNNLNRKNLPHEAVISKSGPDGPNGPNGHRGDRLTDEEVAQIKKLKRQGLAGHVARDQVLRKRHGGNGAAA
jgi:putative DNA primase/helicase